MWAAEAAWASLSRRGLVPAEALRGEADGRQYQAGIRAMGTVEGDKAPLPILLGGGGGGGAAAGPSPSPIVTPRGRRKRLQNPPRRLPAPEKPPGRPCCPGPRPVGLRKAPAAAAPPLAATASAQHQLAV